MSDSKPSFADVMADQKNGLPRAKYRACFSPDLQDQNADLHLKLEDAITLEQLRKGEDKTSNRRLAEQPESVKIAQEIADLMTANPTAFYELEFQAMRADEWPAFKAAHPAREDVTIDQNMGVNFDTLVPAAIARCMVDPEPTEDVLAFIASKMAAGERERMAMVVWNLNEEARDVLPKSRLATLVLNGAADSK